MPSLRNIRRASAALLWACCSLLPSYSYSQVAHGAFVTQPGSNVISWDGSDGISINSLVGADRFYNDGIYGQATVSANVEAGLIWNGHEATSTVQDFYVPTGASGEIDQHATWVGSVLAGYDPSVTGAYPYYKLGMAPLTQVSSGAIATNWYNATDPSSGQQNVYFNVTNGTFYNAYSHYFTQNATHTLDVGSGLQIQFSGPTDVINSSWGYGDSLGTDPLTQAADGLARANPQTTFVVAAGNATTSDNRTNNVGGPASGYNSISVGAVGNFTYNQFNSVADFSSRGPQDYYDPVHGVVPGVRAPVDIVAPGTSIVAAFYGGQTGGNGPSLSTTQPDTTGSANNYYSLGVAGTSFAAPIVAGGVSLLKSASYLLGSGDEARDSRVIKAVLLNSATKLPTWNNGQYVNASGVTVTTQSLDWQQGAGLLNLNTAYDQYLSGTVDVPGTGGGAIQPTGWDKGSIQLASDPAAVAHNDYPIHFTLQASYTLDVTLTWFRDLSAPVFTDNANPDLQTLLTSDNGFANLDLEIWNADFTHLYASSMSRYNDVEELHFALPEDGEYGIRVTYPDETFGTATPQPYGLAWNVTTSIPEPQVPVLAATAALLFWLLGRKRALTA